MGVKMISANKKDGTVVEFSIDTDEIAAIPSPKYKNSTSIILKSGHVMNVEVGYSDLVYLLFNKV